MGLDLYTPQELYRIMFDERQTVSTSFWLDTFFPNDYQSTQEEIRFDKIKASRKIAPFMLPNLPGRPIMSREGEVIESFKPAYTKPKDAMRPSEMIAKTGPEISRRIPLMTPQARWDAEVVRITGEHRGGIERLWQYMGARAVIDGSITISYARGPSVTIDFKRDPGHTITLGAGSRWGESGVNIFQNLQDWIDIVGNAEFGGPVSDVILGANASAAFMASDDVKDKLDTNFRGSEAVALNRGLIRVDPLNPFTRLGTLGDGLTVWRCAGVGNTFQNNDGSYSNILQPNEVFLGSPAVDGVKAFGAILDKRAGINPFDIFPKMWDQDDPSLTQIMSQSAPLMIPVNPNATLKATVLA